MLLVLIVNYIHRIVPTTGSLFCYTSTMSFISSVFYFFTPYADAREQAVGRFFTYLTEHSSQSQTRARLGALLQRNIAVISLWTEYRYKGYGYLHKLQRKKLYVNLELIAQDFDRFYADNTSPSEKAITRIHQLAPHATVDPPKVALLHALMLYFSPTRGLYEYRQSSSFSRLLRDPAREKLVGDCNQIVTLYIYLYSRYHDVHDLQIRMLPGHVALHCQGIDIETTNGTFVNYDAKANSLLPIEEIVSTNLLDTTDTYLYTHEVDAKEYLQAARLAFILSHNRDVVTQNLKAAYGILINALMKRNNYHQALKYALASRDAALLDIVGHNGTVYEMAHHNYTAARRFAQHASKRDELIHNSWQAQGAYHYKEHRYDDAIKAFERIDNQSSIRQCYEALFFEAQTKLGSRKLTAETIKQHADVIKRMHAYAKKSGNEALMEYTRELHKSL